MKYFRIALIITMGVAVINNTMTAIDIIFHLVSLALMIVITYHFPFLKNFGKYVVLLTFWVSLMFMPAFHLVKNLSGTEGLRGYAITMLDYERILSFGSKVLLLTCLSWFVFSVLSVQQKTRNNYVPHYKPRLIATSTVRFIFVIMFALSLFCLATGISRMGAEGVELPFHLAGIITLIRIVFFPTFFAVVVENYFLCNKKIPKDFLILFIIWTLLEVFVRLSKSAIMSSFMVLSVVWYVYYRPNLKSLIKWAVPVFAVFLFLYPIVEMMRTTDGNGLTENFMSASARVRTEESGENPLMQPLNRTFMIPQMYAKDYLYINDNNFFDFSRAPIILAWGGSARYQTFVIDGYPPGIAHSSGTTGLEDPLLFGGYGLCYVVIVLLVLFGAMIDAMNYKKMWSIYFSLMVLLWGFCNSQNITTLTDAVGLQYIFARFAVMWVAFSMNFRHKIVAKKNYI